MLATVTQFLATNGWSIIGWIIVIVSVYLTQYGDWSYSQADTQTIKQATVNRIETFPEKKKTTTNIIKHKNHKQN